MDTEFAVQIAYILHKQIIQWLTYSVIIFATIDVVQHTPSYPCPRPSISMFPMQPKLPPTTSWRRMLFLKPVSLQHFVKGKIPVDNWLGRVNCKKGFLAS